MSDANNGKWKDYLLKSSLPLEHTARRIVEEAGYAVYGEYPYMRTTETGKEAEFAVDLHATDLIKRRDKHWAMLELLIECKYNHPSVRWVFAPHSSSSLVITGCFATLDELTTERIRSRDALHGIERGLRYCARGIELHDSGFDPNSIARGLAQLRYAMPHLVAHRSINQVDTWHEEDLPIHLLLPILVTTASLHVLKDGVEIADVRSAASLDDITTSVDAVIQFSDAGPDLAAYTARIARSLYKRRRDIVERLEQAEFILHNKRRKHLPITWELDNSFEHASRNVLIVNLKALPRFVSKARKLVRSLASSVERVAILVGDVETRTKRLLPIRAAEAD